MLCSFHFPLQSHLLPSPLLITYTYVSLHQPLWSHACRILPLTGPNNNTKKRRPYCHEDAPAEQVLQDLSRFPSTGPDSLPLLSAKHQHYILGQLPSTLRVTLGLPVFKLLALDPAELQLQFFKQASKSTGISLQVLVDASRQRQQPPHKKPRPNPSIHMSVPYSDDPEDQNVLEKSHIGRQPGSHSANAARRGISTLHNGAVESASNCWTGERSAGCFGGFSLCAPCPTYDQQQNSAYDPLPVTASFDFNSVRPAFDEDVLSIQPQGSSPLGSTTMATNETSFFSCDDPALIQYQYIPNYPPLQPSRALDGMQSPLLREEMVYPDTSSAATFPSETNNSRNSGLHSRNPPHVLNRLLLPNTMPSSYTAEVDSPAFNRNNSFVDASRYPSSQGVDVKCEPGGMDVRTVSYNSQRTFPAKRGPFTDNDKREKTARTRKIGSCIRCRMQRIRCNEDEEEEHGPCLSCKKILANISTNIKVYRLGCLRWKITDVKLFKPGQVKGYEWTKRWDNNVVDDIGNWASAELKNIQVTYVTPEGVPTTRVALRVREFRPQPGDKEERTWFSGGVKRTVKIPTFAIVDMESAKKDFAGFIEHGILECRNLLLSGKELLWKTYEFVIKMVMNPATSDAEQQLLTSTLNLWMSVRLTTKSFEIVGDERLGMEQNIIDDQGNPLYGKLPLPPVMGAQIDSILIHQIQPNLRRKTLEDLQKMTQDKKQKTWLTTYLVTFMLLHNLALITDHDAQYAKKHEMQRRWAREQNVKEYNLGANTLLAYFHYCNKGVYPFSSECKDHELQGLAELDLNAINLIKETRRVALNHKRYWETLWREEKYEDEYYYVSQLFEENWQPRIMV
ncbi:hypothetical protein B0H63DRAFT_499022 [Podospora didyma]|uniref:Zn(2)-C6 fungal-type domain-containing protein n=1 Tax=Podospora didyma TaxID=330526 RepID=A0AAE0P702_9PEZI|nr:hypothetical protein B0H63DRAFT_499022 [Podospora didyma]